MIDVANCDMGLGIGKKRNVKTGLRVGFNGARAHFLANERKTDRHVADA
jgi:hypothetical protein